MQKEALIKSLFQLMPSYIGLESISILKLRDSDLYSLHPEKKIKRKKKLFVLWSRRVELYLYSTLNANVIGEQ